MPYQQPARSRVRRLGPRERAELYRQGAKAAARGDAASSNPMHHPRNSPPATGESPAMWSERHDAWLAGHELQSRTPGPRLESGTDEHD